MKKAYRILPDSTSSSCPLPSSALMMPPDTALSSEMITDDGRPANAHPATIIMPNSDNQKVQNLEIRTTGGDHFDNSMSTRIGTVVQVTVHNGVLETPESTLQDGRRSRPPTDHALEEQVGAYPDLSLLDIFGAVFRTIYSVVQRGQQPPGGNVTTAPVHDRPEPPVRAIDFKALATSLKPSSETTPTPAEIYVSHLLDSGHGLPCWDPRARQAELRPAGVVPGDAGTYSVDRGFRKLFNLWDAQFEGVIKRMVTSDGTTPYIPLGGTPKLEPGEITGGTIIAPGSKCRTPPPPPPHQDGIVHEFRFSSSAGGLLVVLSTADLEVTDKGAMRAYITRYAEPIYRFANAQYQLESGDSLYFITGCIKTDASARAAYQPSDDHTRLLQLSRSSSSSYRWNEQPAATYPYYDTSGINGLKNMTLFLQGFKLAISSEFDRRTRLAPAVPASGRPGHDVMGGAGPSTQGRGSSAPDTYRNGNHEGSSRDGTDRHREGGPQEPEDKGRAHGTSEGASHGTQERAGLGIEDLREGFECSEFPPPVQNVYHPSDIINDLLLKATTADFALSHDDDWRHAFREYCTLEVNSTEIAKERLSEIGDSGRSIEGGSRLSITIQNGVACASLPQGLAQRNNPQHGSTEKDETLASIAEEPTESIAPHESPGSPVRGNQRNTPALIPNAAKNDTGSANLPLSVDDTGQSTTPSHIRSRSSGGTMAPSTSGTSIHRPASSRRSRVETIGSTHEPFDPFGRSPPDLTKYVSLRGTTTVAEGGFSSIYIGTAHFQLGPVKVAIKVLKDRGHAGDPQYVATLQHRLRRESATWYAFSHRNIIPLYGLAQDPMLPDVVPGLVFPWCENGTVLEFVQNHPDAQRMRLIRGVASGLQYIHSRGAVHGDIKSAHVLMSNDVPPRPLITDFGCAQFLGVRGYDMELKSSIMYLSPELMDIVGVPQVDQHGRKKSGSPTTHQSDVWAFGLVGAEILGGTEVFRRIRDIQLPSYIEQGGRPKKTDFPNISAEADIVWPLLKLCWNKDPGLRPTMESILASLS